MASKTTSRANPSRQPSVKPSNQVVGNVGLYYVCYRLSLAGWNTMPTSRNAKGVDILAYNQAGDRFVTIQVKALSTRNAIPLGAARPSINAQYTVIFQGVLSEPPRCFVLSADDVARHTHQTVKNGQAAYWLEAEDYEKFPDGWDRIGSGATVTSA